MKRILYHITLLTILLGVYSDNYAQTVRVHRNFDVEDNLPSSQVFCAFQDSDSYMWFGTDNGVCRFDGTEFTNFSIEQGLCDNDVYGIDQDSQGRIWFLSSSNCLSYFKDNKIYNESDFASLNLNSRNLGLHFFSEDEKGNLYFSGQGNEAFRLTTDLSSATKIDLQAKLTDYAFPCATQENCDFIICAEKWSEATSDDKPLLKWVTEASQNDILALRSDGIGFLNGDDFTVVLDTADIGSTEDFERIYIDRFENIYAISGTNYSIFEKQQNGYADGQTYSFGGVFSGVYVDSDNNQWFTSYTLGIYIICEAQKDLSLFRRLRGEQANCLSYGQKGNIVVGTSSNTLLSFNGRNLRSLIEFQGDREASWITQILVDSINKDIWCSGEFGIYRFKTVNDILIASFLDQFERVPVTNVNSVYQRDSIMYLATDEGIKSFNFTELPFKVKQLESAKNGFSRTVISDQNNTVWFENKDKLFKIEGDELTQFEPEPYSFKTKISKLKVTEDNTLVVCTFGSGVFFIKDDEIIHHLSEENGLLSNICNNIFIDGNTHYLATTNGVVIYDWDGTTSKISSTYSNLDGLPTNDIHDVLVKDSLVYIGSSEGLIIFNENYHKRYKSRLSTAPSLQLLSFSSQDSTYNLNKEIDIDHTQTFLNIDFIGISYDRPDEIVYEYKLHAEDEKWIRTKNTSLEFPKFEPDDYNFQLRAKKHNSDWSNIVSFEFTSLPPWWKTWWAKSLWALILGGIALLVMRFIVRRKYEKQLAIVQREQALLEERNRISADMHDDLGSELTKIVILSRIARTKLKLTAEKEQPIIEIDNAASDVVKKMNEIIWALNPTNDTLESLISYLQRYVNDYLDFRDLNGRFAFPDEIPDYSVKAAFRRNTFLIVKECLHNIHKHAQATRVDVSVTISDDIEIIIKEDGVGFNMEKTRRFGNGLINMQKRASDINGNVDQFSTIGNGSTLKLVVPLAKNHDFVLDKKQAV